MFESVNVSSKVSPISSAIEDRELFPAVMLFVNMESSVVS